jgi:hypothetical protein
MSWFNIVADLKVQFEKKIRVIVTASFHEKRYTFYLLTGFNPSVTKNIAQGSVFRGHYSNQFDSNDPNYWPLRFLFITSPTFWNHYKRLASF